jgi:class 3 adenylate cyclase
MLTAETDVSLDVGADMQMCLVVTDIENSTRLSVINPRACAASQDKHDAIMMDLITQFNGTELLREGDSFRVAFKHVKHAIQFCLKVPLLPHFCASMLLYFRF